MRAHLAEIPLGIRSAKSDVPAELEEIVFSMLEKQPVNRPMSAAPLKKMLACYLDINDESVDDTIDTPHGRWSRPASVAVARENELAIVSDLMTQSLSPIQFSLAAKENVAPSVVFITGEAGMGKSHFLGEVARLAGRHGADILEGRCFEGNLAPFQPFVEIIRQMLIRIGQVDSGSADFAAAPLAAVGTPRAADRRDAKSIAGTEVQSTSKETLHDIVRNYSAELLRVAPDLHQWLPGEAFRQVDLSREANYVLRAIATFFVDVATLHGTCLLIEDMHWVDQSSLDLLRHIASILHRKREQCVDSNQSYPRLFICCTARPDDTRLTAELERDRYAQSVPLAALTASETQELLALTLGARPDQIDADLLDQTTHRCKGNPYFVTESMRLWKGSQRVVWVDGKWALQDSPDGSSDWPDSVRGVLRSRLNNISPSAQQILGTCAVIGAIIPVDLLRETVPDVDENEFLDALDELLSRHILYETADPTVLEFTHDLLRELTYEQLASHRRRALHRRVGEVLEQNSKRQGLAAVGKLAGHFYEARVADKAFGYLLDASENALASYAVDEALRHLGRASELEPEIDDDRARFRMHGLAATSHNAEGNPSEAIASLQRQLEFAADPIEKASIHAEIGEVHFRVGDFDQSVEVFDAALQMIGDGRPRSSAAVLASTGSSLARMVLPQGVNRLRFSKERERRRLQVAHRVFSTLELLSAQRNVLHCGQAHGRHVVLSAKLGDPAYLTHASARQALIFGIFSLNGLALRAGRRALTYAQQGADPQAEAIAKGHVGCAHYFGARLAEAEQLLRASVAVLDRRGDSWERMYFYHNLRHLYSITGDTEGEIECARVEMQIGEAVNDPEGTCWGAYGVANAMARSGNHDKSHQYMQRALGILSGRANIVVVPTALQTYGYVHLQSGDYQAARDVLEESCRNIRKDWAFIEYTVRSYPLLAESLLGPHWYDRSQSLDEELVKRSWRISRTARFCAWRFPNYMPHALRVRGRAAWRMGKRKKAIDCFRRAIAVGDSIGARYDTARACIDLSRLDVDDRQQLAQRGDDLLKTLDAVLPAGEEPATS